MNLHIQYVCVSVFSVYIFFSFLFVNWELAGYVKSLWILMYTVHFIYSLPYRQYRIKGSNRNRSQLQIAHYSDSVQLSKPVNSLRL